MTISTRNKKVIIILFLIASLTLPYPNILAQSLVSPNYQIENPTFDSGGQAATSTNYNERDSISGSSDSQSTSTNYKVFPGFFQHAYPGVPAQPTLTNTGSTLYNSLDYIVATGGNPSDAEYAIAISSDSFGTTSFIQADNTVGASAAWQSFVSWGSGSGGRVTGLTASTTYQIKVKARFAADTETAYSITASASTAAPSFTMTIAGIALGTPLAGATTTITSSANAISFSSLVQGTAAVAAQKITITTNATSGYTTTVQEDVDLTNQIGQIISPVSGTNTSPASFPSSVSTGAFGYHTTDATLCTGTVTRFSADDTYAAATTLALEIACNQAAVSNEDTYVVYKALVGALQASGNYTNTITYISTGKY